MSQTGRSLVPTGRVPGHVACAVDARGPHETTCVSPGSRTLAMAPPDMAQGLAPRFASRRRLAARRVLARAGAARRRLVGEVDAAHEDADAPRDALRRRVAQVARAGHGDGTGEAHV